MDVANIYNSTSQTQQKKSVPSISIQVGAQAYNPRTSEVKAGGSRVQDRPLSSSR